MALGPAGASTRFAGLAAVGGTSIGAFPTVITGPASSGTVIVSQVLHEVRRQGLPDVGTTATFVLNTCKKGLVHMCNEVWNSEKPPIYAKALCGWKFVLGSPTL